MRYMLLLLLFCGSLFAQDDCCIDSCCEDTCCWSFGAEWLYFMPSFDQSEFFWDGRSNFVATNVQATATRAGEKQRYYSAYRVDASWFFCNQQNALTARYTNFHKSYFDSLTVGGTLGAPILGIPNELTTTNIAFDRDYRYYNIMGLVWFGNASIGPLCYSVSPGIKFVHLHIKENAHYSIPTPIDHFVQPDMRAWALGPCLELNGAYCLTRCLNLDGRFFWGILADQTHSKIAYIGGGGRYTRLNAFCQKLT